MKTRALFLWMAFAVTSAWPAAPAAAADSVYQEESREDRIVREIAQQLRCAVCQSESVADSNSTLARNMRVAIRERVQAGDSPEKVRAYFLSKYGDYILMEPRKQGLTWVLWLFPFVALVIGGAVIALRATKPRTEAEPAQGADAASTDGSADTEALIAKLRAPSKNNRGKS